MQYKDFIPTYNQSCLKGAEPSWVIYVKSCSFMKLKSLNNMQCNPLCAQEGSFKHNQVLVVPNHLDARDIIQQNSNHIFIIFYFQGGNKIYASNSYRRINKSIIPEIDVKKVHEIGSLPHYDSELQQPIIISIINVYLYSAKKYIITQPKIHKNLT